MKKRNQTMIDEIIDNFNWHIVAVVMEELNWRWAEADGGMSIPTKLDLKVAAQERLESAIKQALNPKNTEDKGIGWISASGGLKATAWRTKNYKLAQIRLEFIIEEWEATK
jgi:hypothetical protein